MSKAGGIDEPGGGCGGSDIRRVACFAELNGGGGLKRLTFKAGGYDGPGAEDIRSDLRYVVCIAELDDPGIGVMFTDTCTSGVGCIVRGFLVGG